MIVFIDDILVYFKSDADHTNLLRLLLQTLKEQWLYAKFSKFSFLLNVVSYVGYVVSSEGIMVDPQKVAMVKKRPKPTTLSDIQSFLDLAGYYRRFAKGYSSFG